MELAALQKKLKSLKKDAKAQESALEEKTREIHEALTDEPRCTSCSRPNG